jgi:hypothetical protein
VSREPDHAVVSTLAGADPEAAEIALDILMSLPADAADTGINDRRTKDVLIVLGNEALDGANS